LIFPAFVQNKNMLKFSNIIKFIGVHSKENNNFYCYLFMCHNIFTYDYETIKKTKYNITKAIIEWTWNLQNINKWIDWKLN
jgi:hypothetical protein